MEPLVYIGKENKYNTLVNLSKLTINAEKAYKLEKFRLHLYGVIALLVLVHVAVSLYYREFFISLGVYHSFVILLSVVSTLLFLWFSKQANSVLFFATMSMEEWKHKSYEISLLHKILKEVGSYPYVPLVVSIVFGLGYYSLVKYGVIDGIQSDSLTNKFGLIWQIHASILGLVFVTLSFLIGLLNADELNKKIDVGKRLANKLHFKLLVIFNTVLTVWVGTTAVFSNLPLWFEATSVGAFIFLIASIVYLFQNFMKYLFQLDLLRELVLKELKQNLRDSLIEEIKQKVSQQLFHDYAKEVNVHVGYDRADAHSEAICSTRKGVVNDVSIRAIKKLSNTISSQIPVRDFKEDKTENFKAVLTKGFGFHSSITDRYDEIAIVPKEQKEAVRELVQSIYIVRDFGLKSEFSENLKQLVDMIISYLKASPNRSLEILEFMGILIDESLEVMSEYQIEFNYETSKQLTHFDWRSIGQIVYSLDDVYKEIYASGNLEMAVKVLSFIEDRIDTSITHKNHYLFKEFFGNYARQYYLAQRSGELSDKEKEEVTKNISKKVESLIKYKIELDQDSLPEAETRDFYIGVVTDIQKVVREMVKGALEYDDVHGVDIFSRMLLKVSSTLDRHGDIHYIENVAESIRMDVESNGETTGKIYKIEYLEKVAELNKKLERNKKLSMFALGAWTLELYRKGEIDEKKVVQIIRPFTQHFSDLESVTQTYFEVKKYNRSEDLNLSSWEIFKKEEGQVHTVRLDWLTYFYVLLVLGKLPNDPLSDQFIYAEGLREYSSSSLGMEKDDVTRVLEDLEKRPEFWKPLLPEKTRLINNVEEIYSDLENKDRLILMHEKGIEQREQEEVSFLIESSIDPEVLKAFKDDFFREYRKANSVKKIIQKLGIYEDHIGEPCASDQGLGTKTLDFKYSYIKDWYVSTVGHAEHYASSMVRGESQKIMEVIEESIESVESFQSDEEIVNRVDTMLENLIDTGHEPNVILVGDWLDLFRLKDSEHFVGGPTNRADDYHGKYKSVEVFYLPSETTRHKVFVIDLKKIGTLKQGQLRDQAGVEVRLEVSEITPEDIEKWIEEDAEIIKKDGEKMSRGDIDKYMGERVLLDMFQKIDFEISDSTAGLYAEGPE